jgi:hypothetical protein
VYLSAARQNANGSLTVTGNRATVVCGGPDDYHYNVGAAVVTGDVLFNATLRVLTPTTDLETLTLPLFASYIPDDHNSRIFMVTGALTGITALSEVYHP